MNEFKITADAYRKAVEQGKFTMQQVEREIAVNDFLATCNQDDLYRLIDSAAFNNIIKAFCSKALQNAEINKETESRVLRELRWLFDTMQSKEVCRVWN